MPRFGDIYILQEKGTEFVNTESREEDSQKSYEEKEDELEVIYYSDDNYYNMEVYIYVYTCIA